MDTDLDESGTESGSKLRERLEAEIAKSRQLHDKLVERVVKEHRYISPEDLKGVSFDQLEAHAAEVEKTKAAQREQILKDTLVEKGVPEDQLDAALERLLGTSGPTPSEEPAPATNRVASLGRLQGTAPTQKPGDGLWGADKIRAAVGSK